MMATADHRLDVIRSLRRFFPKYICALAGSLILFTVGVFSRKHRFLIFQIAKHFGMKVPMAEQCIPTLPLSEVLDRHLNLTLLDLLGGAGNVALLELIVISSLARRANPPVAFEIGTFDGRTALNMAANLPPNGKVYTLDLPKSHLRQTRFDLAREESAFVDKEVSGCRFIGTEFAPKIDQLYGDSATFDFAPYQGKMGIVFVDGSHAIEYVLYDSSTALSLAADGSVILWHDYQEDWPDVICGLNQLYARNAGFSGMRRIEGTSLVILKRENSRHPA